MRPKYANTRLSPFSYVSPPRDFVGVRVGGDVALEVDVVALLDVGLVQVRAEVERDHRRV